MDMKKKWISSFTALALVAAMITGCNSNSSSESKSGTEGKPTGKITVYIGLQEDHAVAAMKKFTADTGIEAEMIRMSAGEILAKVRAEKDNPKADVWYGGPADTYVQAVSEGLLEPYKSPIADKIDAKYKDPDGYWTGVYVGAVGFASNKEFLEKKGLEAPKKWEDLLNPAFKGEVVMADPASSGTAYTALYTVLNVMGSEDKGFEYLTKLHPQVQQYTTSGAAPGRMVGMGEAGVGILFAHDIIKYQEEGFKNLVLTIPEDGTGYETGAIGIIKGSKNQELSQKFVDWTLSPEAQELGKTVGSFQNITNSDAVGPEQAVKLDEINTIDYDVAEAGKQRQRLIDKWSTEVK
ncbi:iron ABC transporter substrate-binding protein [Paenibacillus glacialis]|uniref:Iron ABC transporter substrate-binding protein n=2 Tax=Paenibacillus glacialis TaxID=494026 RepID=A0A162MB55_9BACL|nr:iron ABC transporter substrate-binding protein [Paenibacillus glacialis]